MTSEYWQPVSDREYLRAVSETSYTRPPAIRLDTTLPDRLTLLNREIRSDTEPLVKRYIGGEFIQIDDGFLASRRQRVTTPTDSYWQERTLLGFGAGERVLDVTGLVGGESAQGVITGLNENAPAEDIAQNPPDLSFDTGSDVQTPQTSEPAESASTLEEPPEVVLQGAGGSGFEGGTITQTTTGSSSTGDLTTTGVIGDQFDFQQIANDMGVF